MKKEVSNRQSIRNNTYAVKMMWELSKKRVIYTVINSASGYFEWLFYSIFFLRFVIHSIETKSSFQNIMQFVGLCFVIFAALSMYYNYINAYVKPITDNLIYRKLYRKLYAKARNIELRCFEDAEFYNKYTMAIDGAADKIVRSVECYFGIFFGFIAAIAAFYTMFSIDHYAMLFVIFPIIGNFVFGGMMNKVYIGRYDDNIKYDRKAQYVNRVMYLVDYAKEIRYSNIHDLMMRKYKESVEGTQKVVDKYSKRGTILAWLQNVTTFALVFEGIMIYSAYRTIVTGSMGLAELAIMFTTMSTSSWILIGLFNNFLEALRNGLFLEYFRTFMEYKEKIPEDQDGIMPADKIESIEFRHVAFQYQEGDPLIRDLSFTIPANTVAALVGHNGAGKSTIIKLLFRLYDPTAGEILVNGINIKEYNLKAYRNLFAAAFQDYRVIAASVKDNVLMGRQVEDADKVVQNALEQAGIWEKIKSLPKGMDTILTKEFDEQGAVLSGGQLQKVVVARAFAQEAQVKVFDEPSSALDPIAEYELYNSIMRGSKEQIMLFISHRLSSAKDADVVFMLENGDIIEQGTHVQLMAKNGAYADMYSKQAKNYLAVEEYVQQEEVTA